MTLTAKTYVIPKVNSDRNVVPTVKNIDGFKQNNPQLVINDLREFVDPILVEQSLMRRGIHKWLRNRRLFIQLKHLWKKEIDTLEEKAKSEMAAGKHTRAHKTMGERVATIRHRQQMRAICHSPRLFAWDKSDTKDIRLPNDFPQRPNKRWFKQKDNKLNGK